LLTGAATDMILRELYLVMMKVAKYTICQEMIMTRLKNGTMQKV